MLNTANFLFALVILIFMVGNAYARRTEGNRLSLQCCIHPWLPARLWSVFGIIPYPKGWPVAQFGSSSADATRILTRLDSLHAHIQSLRQDVDVVQRRMWYLSKGQDQPRVLPTDSLRNSR